MKLSVLIWSVFAGATYADEVSWKRCVVERLGSGETMDSILLLLMYMPVPNFKRNTHYLGQ